jgi:hypothetical protein
VDISFNLAMEIYQCVFKNSHLHLKNVLKYFCKVMPGSDPFAMIGSQNEKCFSDFPNHGEIFL